MKRARVIPVLLLQKGGLVKSVKFKDHKYVGDPINAVKIFNEKEVDELVILDISATTEKRGPNVEKIKEIASEAFMPLAYGGGITSLDEIKVLITAGIEKVILNTSAYHLPNLITSGANYVGSQSIVVSIDIKKNFLGKYKVMIENGSKSIGTDPVAFAKEMEMAGAGELCIQSIDRDGTFEGYDLLMIKKISEAVNIPVVALGGASSLDDFANALQNGASAVAAGSMFVFQRAHRAVLISYPGQAELKKKYILKFRAMITDPHSNEYRQCAMSVMDNIADVDITFDEKGICNYYYEYIESEKSNVAHGVEGKKKFDAIIKQIKADGAEKKYDCILGVSGGVDSTYLAYIAKQNKLRVLCVHFDNGWNSELAVKNIQNIVEKCEFDLYTYVIEWNEFKDLQLSYFKANVIDIEAVTDIAIFSALDIICKEQKIKHIIDGRNVVTEHTLPPSWVCKNPSNLKDIHSKYGTIPLKTYPLMSPVRRRIVAKTKPFSSWPLLNYVPYNKNNVKEIIIEKLGWRDYGGKHYESVFTRFYQGYILPQKFKVDKRKAHFSNLIFSGQMTKEQALSELKQPIYPKELFEVDYEFVIKKLGFTKKQFDEYIQTPPVPHSAYKMGISIFDEYNFLKPFKRIFNK